jgi:mRNA-degrading endonuclease RelE of RelBE toxin-antitoxin system
MRAIDQQTALRILHRLARFIATEEGDVKRLRDLDPPEFRLRAGGYRVRFFDRGDSIEILAVKHRREAYR